ncbi:MAG: alpha/beta hydrolase [Bacteroidota bacterium]
MLTTDPIGKNNVVVKGNLHARETIIFSNGFGTEQSVWDKVITPFLENYRIILYDLAGSGKSDMNAFSSHKYDSLRVHADDLIDICKRMLVKDAIFIGHSVSGMIGMLAAIKAPQYFSKMVFISASPRYINADEYVGGFTQETLDELYRNMETNYFAWISGFAPMTMLNSDKPELAEGFLQTLSAIRPDVAVSVVRTIFQSDYRSSLKELTKPALLIHCDNDMAVPVTVGAYMNEHIPNSQLELIAAEGHYPHVSAPEAVIKAIQRFIEV